METTLKNFPKQAFFAGPTFFGLWVMETKLYNLVSTQSKQPLIGLNSDTLSKL